MKLGENRDHTAIQLKDAIVSICKKFMSFKFVLKIEGLIIVTSDEENVVVVKIDENHRGSSVCGQQQSAILLHSGTTPRLFNSSNFNNLSSARPPLALQCSYWNGANNVTQTPRVPRQPRANASASFLRQPRPRQRMPHSSKKANSFFQSKGVNVPNRMGIMKSRPSTNISRAYQAGLRGMSDIRQKYMNLNARNLSQSISLVSVAPYKEGAQISDNSGALVPVPNVYIPKRLDSNNVTGQTLTICDVASNETVETTNPDQVVVEKRERIFKDIMHNALSKLDVDSLMDGPISSSSVDISENHPALVCLSQSTVGNTNAGNQSSQLVAANSVAESNLSTQAPLYLAWTTDSFTHASGSSSDIFVREPYSANSIPAFYDSRLKTTQNITPEKQAARLQHISPTATTNAIATFATANLNIPGAQVKSTSQLQVSLINRPSHVVPFVPYILQREYTPYTSGSLNTKHHLFPPCTTQIQPSAVPRLGSSSSVPRLGSSSSASLTDVVAKHPHLFASLFLPMPNVSHPSRATMSVLSHPQQVATNPLSHVNSGRAQHPNVSELQHHQRNLSNEFQKQQLFDMFRKQLSPQMAQQRHPFQPTHVSPLKYDFAGFPGHPSAPNSSGMGAIQSLQNQSNFLGESQVSKYPHFVPRNSQAQFFSNLPKSTTQHQPVPFDRSSSNERNIFKQMFIEQSIGTHPHNLINVGSQSSPPQRSITSTLSTHTRDLYHGLPTSSGLQTDIRFSTNKDLQIVNQTRSGVQQQISQLQASKPTAEQAMYTQATNNNIPKRKSLTFFSPLSALQVPQSTQQNSSHAAVNIVQPEVDDDNQETNQNFSLAFPYPTSAKSQVVNSHVNHDLLQVNPPSISKAGALPQNAILNQAPIEEHVEKRLPPLRLKNLGHGNMVVIESNKTDLPVKCPGGDSNQEDCDDLEAIALSQVMKAMEGLHSDSSAKKVAENHSVNVDHGTRQQNNIQDPVNLEVISDSLALNQELENCGILNVSCYETVTTKNGRSSESPATQNLSNSSSKTSIDPAERVSVAPPKHGVAPSDSSDTTEVPGASSPVGSCSYNFDLSAREQYQCRLCQKSTVNQTMLAEHYSKYHTVRWIYCRSEDTDPYLRRAAGSQSSEDVSKLLACPYKGCNKSYLESKSVITHYGRAHKVKMTYQQIVALKIKDGTILHCKQCRLKFITKRLLLEHQSRFHR